MPTTITVDPESPIGRISPRLYGHFAEHLGRCCYDGLWLGSQDIPTPTIGGFRRDVVEALAALPVPLLRWPGGCYADHYHWRDGIGPALERPIRLGMSCGLQVEDDNSLGTHEFLALCALLGAEPYLAGNVGSGSPQELCDWLEYCNTAVPTTLGRLRAANGTSKPFGVKLWGVGNENWGCGGNYDAPTYAREYVRYATMLRHVDPAAELVVCGHDDVWNEELLATIGRHLGLVDHLSIHRYWINGGPETDFSEAEYYALLAEADATEDFVVRTLELVQASGAPKPIGIALDEWGVWHPEARPWGPGEVVRRAPITYEQANTLRDALAVGIALEGFHRQCNVLSMANLAQIVNVLQAPVMTEGESMWLTPTYHALWLHTPHIGAQALPVQVDGGETLPEGLSAVSATASMTAAGAAVTVINRHLHADTRVQIDGLGDLSHAEATVLTAPAANAANGAGAPNRVAPASLTVTRADGGWTIEMPRHSMATVVLHE